MNIRLCDSRIAKAAGTCIDCLMGTGARKVTKYLSRITVVKATRRHKPNRVQASETFIITVGKPNYTERKFINTCKKAGVVFPLRKIQYQWYK